MSACGFPRATTTTNPRYCTRPHYQFEHHTGTYTGYVTVIGPVEIPVENAAPIVVPEGGALLRYREDGHAQAVDRQTLAARLTIAGGDDGAL